MIPRKKQFDGCHVRGAIYAALILVVLPGTATPRTWYVRNDGGGDAPTIQAAVDSASSGDSVLVGPGLYTQNTIVINKNIYLCSEAGARETAITTIPWPPGYNLHVVLLDGLGPNSSVQGFTIMLGRGSPIDSGAGIDLRNSSSSILDNIIFDNETQEGAGISCSGGSPIIRRNVIYGNRGGYGCGIFIFNSSALVDSNTIAFNGSECPWPGICCSSGGGIFVQSNVPVAIRNNIIAFNVALEGGGIFVAGSSEWIDFRCNLVFGNMPANYAGNLGDQTGMNGNLCADPQFCAVKPDSSGNFFLQNDSICLPSNNPNGPTCGMIGAFGSGCGPTKTKETSWGQIKDAFKK